MPGVLKAAPTAPLARRQRRALPWEARPAHAGPHPHVGQIKVPHTSRWPVQHTAVYVALDVQLVYRVSGDPSAGPCGWLR